MKQTRILMDMPVTVEISDNFASQEAIDKIFSYFGYIDKKFSVFKDDSEISRVNRGEIKESEWSLDMREVFLLSEKTKKETNGYFDIIDKNGSYNPSGLVKGWAIYKASTMLKEMGFSNFYVDAGGDIQAEGKNGQGKKWSVGIKDPFDLKKIVKVVYVENKGVATSGTYIRGQHIYNPKKRGEPITGIVSLTVIGPNVYEADRFATPAFAMGKDGINFIGGLYGFEGYMIDKNGIATMTEGFKKYVRENN